MNDIDKLKSLGSNNTKYEYNNANKFLLERFYNHHPENDYEVYIEAPEFTSLCPKTGQPDFATIRIWYMPDKYLVESKSFKLYLGSFRMVGEFHEDCINRIHDDIKELLAPKWIKVVGEFTPRGGISFHPTVESVKR